MLLRSGRVKPDAGQLCNSQSSGFKLLNQELLEAVAGHLDQKSRCKHFLLPAGGSVAAAGKRYRQPVDGEVTA